MCWQVGANVQKTRSLNQGEKWLSLEKLVYLIGRDYDLAWYYLGRAAEELKHYDAALKYYGHAMKEINGFSSWTKEFHTSRKCNPSHSYGSRGYRKKGITLCEGLTFPAATLRRISAIQNNSGRIARRGKPTRLSTAKPSISDKELASRANRSICTMALPIRVANYSRSTEWDHRSRFRDYVTEAKRRGLTPQNCDRILGRTTQVAKKPKATTPKPPVLLTLDEDYVALKSANVRSGPGINYARVGRLSKGDAITALGKSKARTGS